MRVEIRWDDSTVEFDGELWLEKKIKIKKTTSSKVGMYCVRQFQLTQTLKGHLL